MTLYCQFGGEGTPQGGTAVDLTGKNCMPTAFQWASDTYSLAHGVGDAVVKAGLLKLSGVEPFTLAVPSR